MDVDIAERCRATVGSDTADQQAASANGRSHADPPNARQSDFPVPRSVTHDKELTWDEDAPLVENYRLVGRNLAESGDLYRNSAYASGLVLGSAAANVPCIEIRKGSQLASIIADRLCVCVMKDGKLKGRRIPSAHLTTMLASELFLQQFPALDAVVNVPQYMRDFRLTAPGYNDAGPGERIFYVGPVPEVSASMDTINRFLAVMAFESTADRTNTVAMALTVMLRNHWPGGKPMLLATSTKSQGGKETIIEFACGRTPHTSLSYEREDWALQKNFAATIKHNRDLGVVNVENVRLDDGRTFVGSAFLERLLTDPQPVFFSTGTGDPTSRKNDIIVAMSTNHALISEDLMNRALTSHLHPRGNVADRQSPIGNPKLEYLPANRDKIEAELRGMIERWKDAGMPLDETVKHPFIAWAQTVGGILKVNGFADFLANYSLRRTADDPLRRGLGLLGSAQPKAWMRSAEWARLAVEIGLDKTVIPKADQGNDAARARGIGVVLSAHVDETFSVETEDQKLELQLEKARLRFEPGELPSTRYRFKVTHHEDLPEDPQMAKTPEPTK